MENSAISGPLWPQLYCFMPVMVQRPGGNHICMISFSAELNSTAEYISVHEMHYTQVQVTADNRLTYSVLHVGVFGVTASTCVCCLTDNICNFLRPLHLWIICHRCYSATDVLLKVCVVHGLYSTPREQYWQMCNIRMTPLSAH